MTPRRKKLAQLARLARVKADIAKVGAAETRRSLDALNAEAACLRAERSVIAGQTADPADAMTAARWLSACDAKLRVLALKEASLRADHEIRLDRARQAEGRRQVLTRLSDQAS